MYSPLQRSVRIITVRNKHPVITLLVLRVSAVGHQIFQ